MSTLDQPQAIAFPVPSGATQEKPGEVQDLIPAFETQGVWKLAFDVFVQNRLAVVGVGVVVFMTLFCFVGPLFYRTDTTTVNLANEFLAPSAQHLLGTTNSVSTSSAG